MIRIKYKEDLIFKYRQTQIFVGYIQRMVTVLHQLTGIDREQLICVPIWLPRETYYVTSEVDRAGDEPLGLTET